MWSVSKGTLDYHKNLSFISILIIFCKLDLQRERRMTTYIKFRMMHGGLYFTYGPQQNLQF